MSSSSRRSPDRVEKCSQLRVDHRPGLHPQGSGEVGCAVVQPRQSLLEPARAAALEDLHVIWRHSARLHCSLQFAFFAGLTSKDDARGARSHTSLCVALPLQLATPTTSEIHQHAQQTLTDTSQLAQVLPRLARRGLTCSRSVTWQNCQGTVVHDGSHSSAS